MADPLIPPTDESKLSALNKKIIEIKKKIQLSEGQRKANFEESNAKKRENCDKIANVKKDVKLLQIELAKAANNEDAAERVAAVSRESSAYVRKGGLKAAILSVDEDNIRLRKKLDLVKYKSDEQQARLATLLVEYEELVNGKVKKIAEKKLEQPLKKKIVGLENQLQRIGVMQMEAEMVRKKYRCVRSGLKSDAAFYVSSLRNVEHNIREQETEIKKLQAVKEEAIHLRDITKETLTRQEIEAMNTSKARDYVISDYRQRVEDRKLELERLERMIFPATRQLPRDDLEAGGREKTTNNDEKNEEPKDEVTALEEAFVTLRSATGVTKNEDVLDRFLAQRATKEKLQKMRVVAEEEKMGLEKQRQQLTAEIETQKFSESKDADKDAEKLEKLNLRINEELQRRNKAELEKRRIQGTETRITAILRKLCDRLKVVSDAEEPVDPEHVQDPQTLLDVLEEKIKKFIESMGGPEKFMELMNQATVDQLETVSVGSKSETGRAAHTNERPLFPHFPTVTTPAGPTQPSDDEEDVPTRSLLKRQAQLLVDTKSRRKGVNVRR